MNNNDKLRQFAARIVSDRDWQAFKDSQIESYFVAWSREGDKEDREALFAEFQAFKKFTARMESLNSVYQRETESDRRGSSPRG